MKNPNLATLFCRRAIDRTTLQEIAADLNTAIATLLAQGATKIEVSFIRPENMEDPDDSLFYATANGSK